MELNDEAPKQHVLRYIENLCMAIISALGEINEISLISVVLDNKEVFPTKYRNMAIMNRMRDNNFPELEILKEHVLESLKIEKERRMDTIDLSDILDVFEKHPETYIEVLFYFDFYFFIFFWSYKICFVFSDFELFFF